VRTRECQYTTGSARFLLAHVGTLGDGRSCRPLQRRD